MLFSSDDTSEILYDVLAKAEINGVQDQKCYMHL